MTARQLHRVTPLWPTYGNGRIEVPEWTELARCAETDPEMFYPESGQSAMAAKRICMGCEVRTECLEDALTHGDLFGVWGGTTERDRRKIRRQREQEAA